jgi:anti-sigma factor RsiW
MAELYDDDAPLTHLEQAMLYRNGDMTPEEKAAYEPHLATCAECQRSIATANKVMPFVNAHLAFKPKRTVDEQVAKFDRERKAREAIERQRVVKVRRVLQFAAIAATAILAAVVWQRGFLRKWALTPTPHRSDSFAPTPSPRDGG